LAPFDAPVRFPDTRSALIPDTRRAERLGILLGLFAVTLFGLTLPANRAAVGDLGPITVGIGRTVAAAIPAIVYLALTRAPIPRGATLHRLIVASAGVVLGFPYFSALAMVNAPAAHGGVMLGILPLATAAAGTIVARERPSLGFWIAGAVGSVGVIAFALLQGAGALHVADLALVAAVISAAIGYAWSGQIARTMPAGQVIAWALVVALPITVPLTFLGLATEPQHWSPRATAGFAYVALVSQFLAFFAWNRGLALGGVARVSQAQLLQPFVTILAAAILLAEPLSLRSFGFAVLVVGAVAIGRRMRIERPPA
jgi:drug/metabolite transporter (DMT)-like permease